ncbi:hypothetical protein BFL35_01285 [Clavibacter michiganensis]|nr:hypothetical protein BFL35_01285 [Clavibacter michiganensis]
MSAYWSMIARLDCAFVAAWLIFTVFLSFSFMMSGRFAFSEVNWSSIGTKS